MVIIDVGAYNGKPFLQSAQKDKSITVYAFEPNPNMVAQINSVKPDNYHIFQMVVSEVDGTVEFCNNQSPQTNSILSFDNSKIPLWQRGNQLKTVSKTQVKSIRLDTFMKEHDIEIVDYLKIDAQGADLQVVRSCGKELSRIKKLQLEVCDVKIYENGNGYDETVCYLDELGFFPIKTVQHQQYKDIVFENEKN